MKYILLSAVIVCIVSKVFCGIGLSSLYCGKTESASTEDKTQSGEQLHSAVTQNKKRGFIYLVLGLTIFLLWVIAVMVM